MITINKAKVIEKIRAEKIQQIDTWTATAITGGFTSAATGTTATYDSAEADQQNIMLMLQAAQTADFATHPIYKGQIPIRAVPEGQTGKVILQHNAASSNRHGASYWREQAKRLAAARSGYSC